MLRTSISLEIYPPSPLSPRYNKQTWTNLFAVNNHMFIYVCSMLYVIVATVYFRVTWPGQAAIYFRVTRSGLISRLTQLTRKGLSQSTRSCSQRHNRREHHRHIRQSGHTHSLLWPHKKSAVLRTSALSPTPTGKKFWSSIVECCSSTTNSSAVLLGWRETAMLRASIQGRSLPINWDPWLRNWRIPPENSGTSFRNTWPICVSEDTKGEVCRLLWELRALMSAWQMYIITITLQSLNPCCRSWWIN